MDWQTILNVALGAICGALGWFARELWSAVQALKDDLYKLREEIARDYIPKTEFSSFRLELFTLLHRIEDKLERKSDKNVQAV